MKIKKSDYEKLTKAFFAGAREALTMYSQLHDGIPYISFGKTLQQAIDELDAEEKRALIIIKETPEVLKEKE